MRIDKDHLYYGAAVIQIAEHPSFTAINDFKRKNATVRCAYWVNQNIGIYLKYRTSADRVARWGDKDANEYIFSFNTENLDHIQAMNRKGTSTFIALICVEEKQICCISAGELNALIARRQEAKGKAENQYTVVVALLPRSKFRTFVTPPARRNTVLGEPMLVAQNDFPDRLFR